MGRYPSLVYVIGIDALMRRAVQADLPDADIRRRRPVHAGSSRRRGPRPDLVVVDLTETSIDAELAAIWSTWGERVVVAGVDPHQPIARIWRHPNIARLVEVGPGFLTDCIPGGSPPSQVTEGTAADNQQRRTYTPFLPFSYSGHTKRTVLFGRARERGTPARDKRMVLAEAERQQASASDNEAERLGHAFLVLGLDPAADADLIEIAYWYQVEVCRTQHLGTRLWPARMTELNEARTALGARGGATVPVNVPPAAARRPHPSVRLRAVATLLPALLLALAITATSSEQLQPRVVAGAAGAAAVAAAFAGWALVSVIARRRPPRPLTAEEAYRALRARETADRDLVTLLYTRLHRRAAVQRDIELLLLLDEAYQSIPPAQPPLDDSSRPVEHAVTDAESSPRMPQTGEPRPRRRLAPPAVATVRAVRRALARLPHLLQPRRRREPPRWIPAIAPHSLREGGAGAGPSSPVGDIAEAGPPALRVFEGGRELQTIPLRNDAVYIIGAAAHCDVHLPAAVGQHGTHVADEHARLTVRRGRVLFHHVAEDSESLVNGARTVWAVLDPGDDIGVGPYVCRFVGHGLQMQAAGGRGV